MKPFDTGVVIGKFCPPHKGHNYLIETASANCEKLFVLVCWKYEQSVPIEARTAFIKEVHPEVNIVPMFDNLDDDDTIGWANYTMQTLGFSPEVVFSSELYGDGYAKAMGAKHKMVDLHRDKIPCSATMIKCNPIEHLDFLAPCVRAYYVKRVCLLGAESTGTTTLSEKIAEYYKTNWVQEYGREYSLKKWNGTNTGIWTSDEFMHIAVEHAKREDELARTANKVLICDTDAFATSLWHERYMDGRRCKEVEDFASKRKYDLYILTGDEIPFVQDGIRDGEHIRHEMHKRFIQALTDAKKNWVLTTGSIEERMAFCIKKIDEILKN